MGDVVADTNILIWYFTDPKQLSASAEQAVDNAAASGAVYISAISIVELIYLTEKKRVRNDILDLLKDALDDPTTGFRLIDLSREIAESLSQIPRSIVADVPDRIISATAYYTGLPLITSDGEIRKLTNVQTIW